MVVLVFQLHPEFSAWGNPRLVPEKGALSQPKIIQVVDCWGNPWWNGPNFREIPNFSLVMRVASPFVSDSSFEYVIIHKQKSPYFLKHWTQPVGVPHLAVESAVDPPNWAPQLGRGPGSSPKPNSPAIACWWNASWAICCIPSLVGGFNPSEKY